MLFSRLLRAALLGVAVVQARPAAAQALPGTVATTGFTPSGLLSYPGPHYPGGPDSLRAQLARLLRPANPAWVGNVFVRLRVDATGAVQQAGYLVPPPGTPAATLVRNADVRALITQVVRQLPRWQPAPAAPGQRPQSSTFVLQLPFGRPTPAPLPYSLEEPVFELPGVPRKNGAAPTVLALLQRRFRYPAEDLRDSRQGEVVGYYEVSETGAVENQQVVGSLSPTIDAELLQALRTLPPAAVPPRQQGRAVRVGYVVALSLTM